MQISNKKSTTIDSSKKQFKNLSWQERRKLERQKKQQEEDEQTLAKVEIHRKQVQGSLVVIEYTIKAKNTGRRESKNYRRKRR